MCCLVLSDLGRAFCLAWKQNKKWTAQNPHTDDFFLLSFCCSVQIPLRCNSLAEYSQTGMSCTLAEQHAEGRWGPSPSFLRQVSYSLGKKAQSRLHFTVVLRFSLFFWFLHSSAHLRQPVQQSRMVGNLSLLQPHYRPQALLLQLNFNNLPPL